MGLIELLEHLEFSLRNDDQASAELYFDDEPLDRILYGSKKGGPTRANLYLPIMECIRKIRKAFAMGDIQAGLLIATECDQSGLFLTDTYCHKLVDLLGCLIPNCPNLVLEHDLSAVGPLFERMWEFSLYKKNEELQLAVGGKLYRLYEHYRKFEEARHVLLRLIELYGKKKNSVLEAVHVNNFAFEYLLEGKWEEAIPLFDKAAKMFLDRGEHFEFANAKANCWTCRFELGDVTPVNNIERELKSILKTLDRGGEWRSRKPLILLAKIKERQGNIQKAIRYVQRAIEICRKSTVKTQYSEIDSTYLEQLKNKQKNHSL